jgi:hypothetical protein
VVYTLYPVRITGFQGVLPQCLSWVTHRIGSSSYTVVWSTMDTCIRNGVTSIEPTRRAPGLYKRLQRGFYPTNSFDEPASGSSDITENHEQGLMRTTVNGGGIRRVGRKDHVLGVVPRRNRPVFPGIEYLSCMAIAVSGSVALSTSSRFKAAKMR